MGRHIADSAAPTTHLIAKASIRVFPAKLNRRGHIFPGYLQKLGEQFIDRHVR